MSTDKRGFFTEEQYLQIWDMIFSQTGYPVGHPKNESALNEDTVVEDKGGIPLPKDLISTDNLHFVGADGIKKPLTDLYEKKYTQAQVDAIREELEHQINFWKESNNSNYESFKRVAYELRALKKQYGQISLNPDNKAYTGKEEKMSNKKIEIQSILNTFKNFDGTQTYEIKVTDLFPPNSGEKIKDAIESVINNVDDLTVQDYKDVIDDHKRLVKELDIIINGKNAAESPSLCDLVSQLKQPTNDTGKDSKVVTDNTDVACLSLNDVMKFVEPACHPSEENFDEIGLRDFVTKKLKTHTP